MSGISVLLCVAALAAPVSVDVTKPPARNISEYNLFKDAARQIPNDDVLPYDLNTPLYSDYASKHRFIWLPEGAHAEYRDRDVFEFPVGTVIAKTFGFLKDIRDASKGERIVETRLLIHKPEGWAGFAYIWNEDATEARLAVAGGRADVSWTHYDGQVRKLDRYIIPNMNECKQCHEIGGKLQPIGPKARHLNKDYAYPEGAMNQLLKWQAAGYLGPAPAPESAPRLPNADDPASGTLNERARAYLDINCAHCHNPEGPAHMSGLDLSYDQLDAGKYGVFKSPIAAGRGSGGYKFGIEPGHPEVSILMHRVESTEPGVMMPPLPKRMIHDEGVALLREWILAMQAQVTAGNTVELVE